MKIILFFTITVLNLFIYAAGIPELTKNCQLMSIAADQLIKTADGGCALKIKIKTISQPQAISLNRCPVPFKNKYVYVWRNIEVLELDDMEITSSKHCDKIHYGSLRNHILGYGKNGVEKFLNDNVKEKDLLSKITKLHFFRIRTKDNIWTYHYSPGVSVDIEVTGEMCDGKLCMDEKKQKFSKLLKTYIDFIWMDDNDEVYYSSALDQSVRKLQK